MLADFAYTGFCDKLEFGCYFALPQSNQKAVKENLDNPENVPDIDIRYFIRSYFACHIVRIFASCIALLIAMHMRVCSILPLPKKCTLLALFGSPIGFPGDVGLTPTSFGIKEQPPINAKVLRTGTPSTKGEL